MLVSEYLKHAHITEIPAAIYLAPLGVLAICLLFAWVINRK
jgi:hypothetical protein